MREPEYSPAATGIHPWSSASAKMERGVESESVVQPKVALGGLARFQGKDRNEISLTTLRTFSLTTINENGRT